MNEKEVLGVREALFYEKKEQGTITVCRLCPKKCAIPEDQTGFCRTRENQKGVLYATNYGKMTSYSLDPIEKKPLYHFYPGSMVLSLGTLGCNLRCAFCQNWSIAHKEEPKTVDITPEQVVALAQRQVDKGYPNIGIAYTYSEPFVWYEFVLDTARLAQKAGLKNILVTNGYINENPLRGLISYIDAMNIDLKGFNDSYYHGYCSGQLEPVLRTIEIVRAERCHLELTNLLVTGLNDDSKEIGGLVDWIAALDKEIPLHLSRYFPSFEVNLPPTPPATLKKAAAIAQQKLSYVYIGNAQELAGQNTYCPKCGKELINRVAYQTVLSGLVGNECRHCSCQINIANN